MWTTAAVAILTGVIWIVKYILSFFTAEAKLRRLELWRERLKTRAAVEAERLEAAKRRIDLEPDKTGQDLVDDLNEKFKGGGDAPKP